MPDVLDAMVYPDTRPKTFIPLGAPSQDLQGDALSPFFARLFADAFGEKENALFERLQITEPLVAAALAQQRAEDATKAFALANGSDPAY